MKTKYLVISSIIFIILLISYFYTESYGYPWEHIEIKKEAVDYMKNKYNMDVNVVKSFYNWKFKYYYVEIFNTNDKKINIINVEKQKFYDDNGQYLGERLEDNYSQIYWENRLIYELQTKYPKFFKLPDVEKFNSNIAYFTTPLESGVSPIKDENGVFIPLKPALNPILDIDLVTEDFSDEFLNELLLVIKDLVNKEFKIDLFITGKGKEKISNNNAEKTKLLELQYEKFKNINRIEDLKII